MQHNEDKRDPGSDLCTATTLQNGISQVIPVTNVTGTFENEWRWLPCMVLRASWRRAAEKCNTSSPSELLDVNNMQFGPIYMA